MNVSRDLGLKEHISYNLYLSRLLALHRNDYAAAMERFREYFSFDRALEEKISTCRFLMGIAAITGGVLQFERCAQLFGAAQFAIESTSDFQINLFDRAEFHRYIQVAQDQLGNSRFKTLTNEGAALSSDAALELAIKTKI